MPDMCSVPGCKSNYKSSLKTEGYIQCFLFPKDPELREYWLRAISRSDWIPSNRSCVCIKHFRDDDLLLIEKYKNKDGVWCEYRRKKPVLDENAIPELFPNVPSYFSDTKVMKRKSPEERRQEETERMKIIQQDEELKTEKEKECILKNDGVAFVEVKSEFDADAVVESSILQIQNDQQQSECSTAQQGCSFWPDVTNKRRGSEGLNVKDNKCHSFKTGDSSNFCDGVPNGYQPFSMDKNPLSKCETPDSQQNHIRESGVLDDSNDSDSESSSKEYVINFVECDLENDDDLNVELILRNDSSSDLSTVEHNTPKKMKKLKACPKCEYKTFDCSNMNAHKRIHTGEKPFECKICYKKFLNSSHLNNHIRTHTGEKPFKCPVCSKTFAQSSALKTHLRTHTGEKHFECTVCTKMFSRSADVRSHMMTHTKEKPFKCKVCFKTFSRSNNLKSHMGIHASEKQFVCTVCSKTFSYSCNLIRHMRVHR